MLKIEKVTGRFAAASLLTLLAPLSAAQAFKQIDTPGGGSIAYAGIPGAGSPTDGMVAVLKAIHRRFGYRPTIGQGFQERNGTTIGLFFTVQNRMAGDQTVSGLALVSAPFADQRSGAVVYDTPDRFRKSLQPLVTRLSQEWPPRTEGSSESESMAPAAPAQPLQTVRFPDNTGVVGLPAGWRPIQAAGGAVQAAGPNGEELYFNDSASNIDPTNPGGRQMIQLLTTNGRPLPNHTFANSFRAGAAAAFVSTMRQRARKLRKPDPLIKIETQFVGEDNSIYYTGKWDARDGRGPKTLIAMVRCMRPGLNGAWTMFMYHIQVPTALARQEMATLTEIWQSFHTNDGLIMKMNKQITANIVATSEANTKAFNDHMRSHPSSNPNDTSGMTDASARGAQAVCNYIRGNAVIGDSQTGAQATVGNDLADVLVQANPERLQIIQPSQFNHSQY